MLKREVQCNAHVISLPRAYQGDMSGNSRGWNGFFAPGQGETQEIVSESMNWGGEIHNIVESWMATMGIYRLNIFCWEKSDQITQPLGVIVNFTRLQQIDYN